MPNRSCHQLLRWRKKAALRSKSKSKQRYKMFLDASASSSPSKSRLHYAHTDGGVSAIRFLNQSVDEPPDSPARAPESECEVIPPICSRTIWCVYPLIVSASRNFILPFGSDPPKRYGKGAPERIIRRGFPLGSAPVTVVWFPGKWSAIARG